MHTRGGGGKMGGLDRREFLRLAAAAGAGAGAVLSRPLWAQTSAQSPATQPSATQLTSPGSPASTQPFRRSVTMARFPEKADLILLTDRPPQLETPIKYFREDLTPNEAFFVRWHLGNIPTSVDTGTFRLAVGGHVDAPLSLSIEELKRDFEAVSVV